MSRRFIGPSPECLICRSLSVYISFVSLFSNVRSLFSEKKQKSCFVMEKKMPKEAMKDESFITRILSLHNILLSLQNIFCSLHNIFMTLVRSSGRAATSG